MQRTFGSTLVGIIVVVIVIVWIASDPPPARVDGALARERTDAPALELPSEPIAAPTIEPAAVVESAPAPAPDAEAPLRRWTGRVLLASGASAVGVDVFEVRAADGRVHGVSCDERGAFETELPAGEYVATMWTARGDTELAKIALAGTSLERDLVVPGIELAGRIEFQGAPRDAEASAMQVWIQNLSTARKNLASRSADGRSYACFGLEPGDYAVTVFPHALLDGGADGLHVTLDASTDRVGLDLKVAAP